jgi:site-specific DNA recombinase
VVNDTDAALVRRVSRGLVEMGSCTRLLQVLRTGGATTKRGRPLTMSDVYRMFSNRVCLGEAAHKRTAYSGEHDAIVDQAQWDAVHAILQVSPRVRVNRTRNTTVPLLRGLICDIEWRAMSPRAKGAPCRRSTAAGGAGRCTATVSARRC